MRAYQLVSFPPDRDFRYIEINRGLRAMRAASIAPSTFCTIYRRMEFPELKRTVSEMAARWKADVVLVEDKASGTQLVQQLVSENVRKIQAAPLLEGDKVMRLHSQAGKIENGAARFPKSAVWLDAYLLELTTFPNSKNDDQVDSTVNALAWGTREAGKPRGFFSM